MTEDLINKKDIYFPSYLGTNDNLITLLNKQLKFFVTGSQKPINMVHYHLMRISSA